MGRDRVRISFRVRVGVRDRVSVSRSSAWIGRLCGLGKSAMCVITGGNSIAPPLPRFQTNPVLTRKMGLESTTSVIDWIWIVGF